jgi:hypothetical protein
VAISYLSPEESIHLDEKKKKENKEEVCDAGRNKDNLQNSGEGEQKQK